MNGKSKFTDFGRRQFLLDTVKTACSIGLLGTGLGVYSRQVKSLPPDAIRPPGALTESEFASACVR